MPDLSHLAVFFMIGGMIFIVDILTIVLVLPLWAIASVIGSEGRTNGNKIVWVIAIVLLWDLGAILYCIFGTRSPALRWCTVISYAIFVCCMFSLFRSLVSLSRGQIPHVTEQLASMKLVGITENERTSVQSAVAALSQELDRTFTIHIHDMMADSQLIILLQQYLLDNQLDAVEYKGWYGFYTRRRSVSLRALQFASAQTHRKT